MKKSLLLSGLFVAGSLFMSGQTRYVDEIYTDSDLIIHSDQVYGVNFSAYVPAGMGGPQVIPLYMDIYMPDTLIDTEQDRPVMMYFHTGSFLPPGFASPMGERTDSAAVEICKHFARRGYVAVSATYRLGWQPTNTQNLDLRRGSNLLAVYNALQDAKTAVRFIRVTELAQGDPFQIDSDNIMLLGQGSGGYITFAYATLDKYSEVTALNKFQYQDTVGIFGGTVSAGDPYVDTAVVGDWNGYGGAAVITGVNGNGLPTIDMNAPGRNIINYPGVSSDVKLVVNLGGALGDQSWLEPGDVPMLSLHNIYDFFAPYDSGMVRVPVSGQFWDVVAVAGSHRAIRLANEYYNNYVWQRENYTDPVWQISKSHPGNSLGLSGIYPFAIPPPDPNLPFAVNANPWDWWDPNDPLSSQETNPNIKSQSMAYIDTVMDFIIPRIKTAMDANDIGIVEPVQLEFSMYPNPTSGDLNIRSEEVIESVRILDLSGKVVYSSEPKDSNFTLSTADWAKGIYIVRVKSKSTSGTERLTVL